MAIQNFPAKNFGFFYKGHGGPATTDISKGAFDTRLVSVHPRMGDARIEKKYSKAQHGWDFKVLNTPLYQKTGTRKNLSC